MVNRKKKIQILTGKWADQGLHGCVQHRLRRIEYLGLSSRGVGEKAGDLGQGPVGDLKKSDAVVGIALGLYEGGDIGLDAGGDRETRCIVGAGVDF